MDNIKTLASVALVALIVGFIIGLSVNKSPSVSESSGGGISYLDRSQLNLPKFNKPKLNPTGQLIFLRGKTETKTDTVYQSICEDYGHIEVPTGYPSDILLSEREPISKSGNELQFRHYDPRLKSEVINTYQLEPSPWQWSLRLDAFTPVYTLDPAIGPRLEVGHDRLLLNIGTYLRPSTQSIHAVGGVSIKLTGS